MIKEHYTPKSTLCWACKNAVPGENCGCSWSRQFQPVEGWKAKAERLTDVKGVCYRVQECPEFVPEEQNPKEKDGRNCPDEPYLRLAETILQRTFQCYRQSLRDWAYRRHSDDFIRICQIEHETLSPYFETLTLHNVDLLSIVNTMRRKAGLAPRGEDWGGYMMTPAQKKRAERLKAAGICIQCGFRKADPGYLECAFCRKVKRERDKVWYNRHRAEILQRARAEYWSRIEAGICTRCGKRPAQEQRRLCAECAQWRRKKYTKRGKEHEEK